MRSAISLVDVFCKRDALRISAMIDSQLIWYKHYFGWADRLILELNGPPQWVIEIATIRYYPDAVAAARRFVYSAPFEAIDDDLYDDEYIACLLLRYQISAISWATFLNEAGKFADGGGGRLECEHFYEMLNELEGQEFASNVEASQRARIEGLFADCIATIRPLFVMFMEFFREHKEPANSLGIDLQGS